MKINSLLTWMIASLALSFSHSALPQSGQAQRTPSDAATARWLEAMSPKLAVAMPDQQSRIALLKIVAYESKRAGVDSQLVLALIENLSQFRKYAVSVNGSKGYMQIHPTWPSEFGRPTDVLFHTRTNIRYGCLILRNYLDEHKGDFGLALTSYERQVAGQFDKPPIKSDIFAKDVMTLWRGKWRYAD